LCAQLAQGMGLLWALALTLPVPCQCFDHACNTKGKGNQVVPGSDALRRY